MKPRGNTRKNAQKVAKMKKNPLKPRKNTCIWSRLNGQNMEWLLINAWGVFPSCRELICEHFDAVELLDFSPKNPVMSHLNSLEAFSVA